MGFGAILGSLAAESGLDWLSDAENFYWKKRDVDLQNEQTVFNAHQQALQNLASASINSASLKQAGLNPALATAPYSGGVSAGSGGRAPESNISATDIIAKVKQNEIVDSQIDNLKEQNDNLKEQNNVLKEEARSKRLDNDRKEAENQSFDHYFTRLFPDDKGYYLQRHFNLGDKIGIEKAYELQSQIAKSVYDSNDYAFKQKVLDVKVREKVEEALGKMDKLDFEKMVESVKQAKTETERLEEVKKRFLAEPNLWKYLDDALDGDLSFNQGVKLALIVLVSALSASVNN